MGAKKSHYLNGGITKRNICKVLTIKACLGNCRPPHASTKQPLREGFCFFRLDKFNKNLITCYLKVWNLNKDFYFVGHDRDLKKEFLRISLTRLFGRHWRLPGCFLIESCCKYWNLRKLESDVTHDGGRSPPAERRNSTLEDSLNVCCQILIMHTVMGSPGQRSSWPLEGVVITRKGAETDRGANQEAKIKVKVKLFENV